MSKKKLAKARKKLASGKTKSRCCKSSPRCISCPVVIKRLQKIDAKVLSDKQLKKALVQARRY